MTGERRWVLALVGLTFLAGLAAGVWGQRAFLSHAGASSASSRRSPRDWRSRTVGRYCERLQLDDEQRSRLETIFERKRESYRDVFEPIRPRLKEIREATRTEIRGVLRAGQIPQFEKLCTEEDERHRSRHREEDSSGAKPEEQKQ